MTKAAATASRFERRRWRTDAEAGSVAARDPGTGAGLERAVPAEGGTIAVCAWSRSVRGAPQRVQYSSSIATVSPQAGHLEPMPGPASVRSPPDCTPSPTVSPAGSAVVTPSVSEIRTEVNGRPLIAPARDTACSLKVPIRLGGRHCVVVSPRSRRRPMSPFRQNTTVSSRVGQELGFGRVGAGPTVGE